MTGARHDASGDASGPASGIRSAERKARVKGAVRAAPPSSAAFFPPRLPDFLALFAASSHPEHTRENLEQSFATPGVSQKRRNWRGECAGGIFRYRSLRVSPERAKGGSYPCALP